MVVEKPKAVYVVWKDSYHIFGWNEVEDFFGITNYVYSLGWLVYEDEEVVVLAQSYDEPWDDERHVGAQYLVIPKLAVEAITQVHMARRAKKWIQGAIKRPGAFKRKARAAGMTTAQYARKVRSNPSRYSARTVRQANLAITLGKLRRKKR